MSSKHLMYLANYLDLLFHLIDRQLSLRRQTSGNEQFVKVLLSIRQVVQTRQFIKICGEGNNVNPIFYLILLPVKTDLADQKMSFKPCFQVLLLSTYDVCDKLQGVQKTHFQNLFKDMWGDQIFWLLAPKVLSDYLQPMITIHPTYPTHPHIDAKTTSPLKI